MYYVALLFLILLGGTALIVVVQNVTTLLTSEHLMLITLSLPGTPILLICACWTFLGALLLYVFSAYAARRDTREIKTLHARIKELEKTQEKAQTNTTSGPLAASIPPPTVPVPNFPSTGPLRQWQAPTHPLPNFAPTSPLQQGQASNPNNSSSPSAQIPMPMPLRPLPPSAQQGGVPPPFQHP